MIVIDGYNLIYSSKRWSDLMDDQQIETARHDMLECVSKWAQNRNEPVTVFFDGRTGHRFQPNRTHFKYGKVRVLFSGDEQDADTGIRELIATVESPPGVTVVTSDRELKRSIVSKGGKVKESDDFRIEVFEKLKQIKDSKQKKEMPDISYTEYMEMLEEYEDENN